MATGGLFVACGIKGWSPLTMIKDIVTGKSPATGQHPTPLTTPGQNTTPGAPVAATINSAIANDALQYVGHKYIYGGPSNVNGGWDCSSFVSWVLGHDLGVSIPGGSWASVTANGTQHGPNVSAYRTWSGVVSVPQNQVEAGDLITYGSNEHIAIATSRTTGVSAEQPSTGTGTGPLSSGPGSWTAHRLRASVNIAPTPSGVAPSNPLAGL
jgi:cell wall-associated NlpC family hydrolase